VIFNPEKAGAVFLLKIISYLFLNPIITRSGFGSLKTHMQVKKFYL